MKICACDDEPLALSLLSNAIKTAAPDAELSVFSLPEKLLEAAEKICFDAAFMDIEMRSMTGLELAAELKKHCPQINIVFVTGYRQYTSDAWDLMVSGYVSKPVTADKIRSQLDNLRYPITVNNGKRVRIQCFGNFDVFVDGEPLKMLYERSKELIAYLVDRRGAECTTAEICAVLWDDDKNHSAYFQQLRKDVLNAFCDCGCEGVVDVSRGRLHLNMDMVDCDYYNYLSGKNSAVDTYRGEYMRQYSWAEYMNNSLYAKY